MDYPLAPCSALIWNGMISMSFQLVGFLLTYLLHTTHAAKNGSRAGLGLTLVQYGFYMKGSSDKPDGAGNPGNFAGSPPDPNSHNFDPSQVNDPTAGQGKDQAPSGVGGISSTDWIAYVLMIVGWFILIRSVSDFLRARRHEQLVLQSPQGICLCRLSLRARLLRPLHRDVKGRLGIARSFSGVQMLGFEQRLYFMNIFSTEIASLIKACLDFDSLLLDLKVRESN